MSEKLLEDLYEFKASTSAIKNHAQLIEGQKVVLYAATLLDSDDEAVLSLCLDILDNFVGNKKNHSFLLSTFGIYEALENLAIRTRATNEKIYKRARSITETLRASAGPSLNTRSREKKLSQGRTCLYLLQLEGLDKENVGSLEHVLLRIKGIVSFMIDLEVRRCTLRLHYRVELKNVIGKVQNKCGFKILVVTKDKKTGAEDMVDIIREQANTSCYQYPEECSFVAKEKALIEPNAVFVESGGGILTSILRFCNEKFYW
nr:unnamed protein product [Callosobruchus chinensis]